MAMNVCTIPHASHAPASLSTTNFSVSEIFGLLGSMGTGNFLHAAAAIPVYGAATRT